MIQELVNNALKHAQATSVEVKFTWTSNHLNINVIDNGSKGFDVGSIKSQIAPGHGLGLLSLRNRANLLPANLLFENNFPKGTNVSVNYTFASPNEN